VMKLEAIDRLDKQDQAKLELYRNKLKTLEAYNLKIERQVVDRVCAKMAVKFFAPQRYSQPTAKEETVRCDLTRQQFDERGWLASCASEQLLFSWASDPISFVDRRAETWLVFSDQTHFAGS
jgi:hypothetical protein